MIKSCGCLVVMALLTIGGCGWFISAEQRVARAEKSIAAGDDRSAVIELQNATRSEPANVRAHLLLAEASLRLADPKAADQAIAQATAHGASAAATASLSAKTRVALGEFEQLLKQLDSGQLALVEPEKSTYRGMALLGLSRPEEATAAFEQALEVDPSAATARLGIADARLSQGNTEAALSEVDSVLKADPKNALAWFTRGTILARKQDFKSAAAALESARQHAAGQLSVHQHSAVLASLTEVQLASGDIEAAKKTQAQLHSRVPDAPATRLLAARIALSQQDYATAVGEAQKVVSAVPQLASAKLLLGAALLAQGNLNQAEVQLSDLVRQAPDNVEARKLLARVNLQMQRPDVAMQLLTPIQQSIGNDPQLASLVGQASLQSGDESGAIALLERAVAARSANSDLELDLATVYLAAGQTDKAMALLESMQPTQHDTRRNSLMVAALSASANPATARAQIERIAVENPQDVEVLNLVAAFHARNAEMGRAREVLTLALKAQPKNALTLLNLARVEAAANDLPAANSAITKALATDSANNSIRFAAADIAWRSGDVATAVARLEEIRAADSELVEPRLLLARAYLQQHNASASEQVIEEILPRAKQDPRTANALGRFYLDAGRFDQALSQFDGATRLEPRNALHVLNVARAQLALGNDFAAREALQKTLSLQPESMAANAALVMLDLRENRREAAQQRIAELKKRRPSDAAVVVLEGDVAMASQSYAAAAAAFDSAAKTLPTAATAIKAYRARQLGKLPNATQPLETWLQRRPDDVSTRMILAEAHVVAGQKAQAIRQYQQVVEVSRPNPMALNNLAWMYHETGDPRALETAKRAFGMAPQVAAIADTYGWILVHSSKAEEALPILRKAVAGSKGQPEFRYHLAAALARSGDRAAARRELLELTRSGVDHPSAADARKLLDELGP